MHVAQHAQAQAQAQSQAPESSAHRRHLLPSMRLLLLVFSVLTALGVLTLYLFSADTDRLFAWTIAPPLTAAFLGAGYASGFVLVLLSRRDPVWAHNRIPVLTILVFTAVTLVATLLHIDKFHFSDAGAIATFAAWFWLAVYVIVPVAMLLVLLPQERAPGEDPPTQQPIPAALRLALAVESAFMLGVGATLFVVPSTSDTLWPWTLTPLTARTVAAWLLAFGLATGLAALGGDLRRLRTATIAYTVFGVAQLVALARFRDTVAWERPVAWVLTGAFVAVALTGAAGWFASRPSARTEVADAAR